MYLLVCVIEQNLVGISAVMPGVFYRHLSIHMTCHWAIMWRKWHHLYCNAARKWPNQKSGNWHM